MKPSQAAADYAEAKYFADSKRDINYQLNRKYLLESSKDGFDAGQSHHASIVNPVLREALEALEECKKYIVEQRMKDRYVFQHESVNTAEKSIQSIKNILGDESL